MFRWLAVRANQIHGSHPPIARSGLYWAAPVPADLKISSDEIIVTLEMRDVPVIDQPRWPALDSIATPAHMTFKMVWKSTQESVRYENPSQQFRFTGHRAECQLEGLVEVPSSGFSRKSNPLETSGPNFAVTGEQVNGRNYP